MNVAPVISAPQPVRPLGVRDRGRVLSELRIRTDNLEDGYAFTRRGKLVAGDALGSPDGYDTLASALRNLRGLTEGMAPAATVVERAGRFYAHEARLRDAARGISARSEDLHLETDELTATLELRAELRHARLRAVVDGGFSHRFRG